MSQTTTVYPKGLYIGEPNENAPEFVKGKISVQVQEFTAFLNEHVNDKGYDVNIVGVRNSETKGRVTNAFDDHITISYKLDGEWQFHCYKCTTDPGTHWVENIMREEGVAVLKPGQYRGSHKIRLHQGKYPALGQQRDVTVYRDNNRDGKYDLDENNTQTGLFGINIHRATARPGRKSTRVDK